MTVGVVLPTLNAEPHLEGCLRPLLASPIVSRVLVVDSESSDGTVALARSMGVEVLGIRRSDFNHGATRELGRKTLGTEVVVMATQDILPTGPDSVERLVEPILNGKAVAAYGRQLPRPGADIFEALPRLFNYPDQSQTRGIADAKALGVYTFFCSDSFAAYSNPAVEAAGGFPRILTNEDYFLVAKLLERGGLVAYVAEAQVTHSHRYTLREEFNRYHDTGYVRGLNPWVQTLVGQAEKRGASFARALFAELLAKAPHLLPYAVLHCGAKWLGYRLGFYRGHLAGRHGAPGAS
jgi:rhamnosyltransferase